MEEIRRILLGPLMQEMDEPGYLLDLLLENKDE